MCGIVALLGLRGDPRASREQAVLQARLIRHRGPDWSGVWADDKAVLAHERLAIVDVLHGAQPLLSPDGQVALAVNGEIYNHRQLRSGLRAPYKFKTGSDCEVILPLWLQEGTAFLDKLRGMYAFVLVDRAKGQWMVARDPMGIVPLYWGRCGDGTIAVASEMKALLAICSSIESFPPGHVLTEKDAAPRRWWSRSWTDFDAVEARPFDPAVLREALVDSVRVHLMSDVPYGVLLSGGLDSSVVAAIAAKLAEKRVESDGAERAWWPRLHSFAVGLEGSPDLAASQKVADALSTAHHAFTFTFQEGLDAIRDVIWHIETYDVTTIRASTPMYLMARRIRTLGVKMVLSGEGSDELFGGYLYFHKAPDPRAFHEELARKLSMLHLYDNARANKSLAAWGIEARVPFLDRDFMDVAMSLHASHKMCGRGVIEKRPLRQAFEGWIPEEILWRQKEQFSDGVGYGWIDGLKAHAAKVVSDADMAGAAERFAVGTPATKEAFFYRAMFEELFPHPSAALTVPGGPSVACSTPAAIAWDASFANNADPSGRAVKDVHKQA